MKHIALILALGFIVAGTARAAEPAEQFSADQVMTMQGKVIHSRLYVDSGNLRTEMQVPGGPLMTSIVNAEKRVVWMLMPGNMYVEHALAQDDDVSRSAWTSSANRERLGTEVVNGVSCDKYRIKGAQELTFYADETSGLPVLMKSSDGKINIEWRNAKAGPQPAALFQLPAGVQKLSMPSIPGLKLPGLK